MNSFGVICVILLSSVRKLIVCCPLFCEEFSWSALIAGVGSSNIYFRNLAQVFWLANSLEIAWGDHRERGIVEHGLFDWLWGFFPVHRIWMTGLLLFEVGLQSGIRDHSWSECGILQIVRKISCVGRIAELYVSSQTVNSICRKIRWKTAMEELSLFPW